MDVDCIGTSSAREEEEEGATSPLVAATRAVDCRDGARRGHSQQLSEGWVARHDARRPTGTEDGELSWCAPWRPEGARGAGGSSHGRLRGCHRASPLSTDVGGHCSRSSGRHHGAFPPQGRVEEVGRGGE